MKGERYELWGIPIPDCVGEWLEEVSRVPWGVRAMLLWIGFVTGLLAALFFLFAGAYLAYT